MSKRESRLDAANSVVPTTAGSPDKRLSFTSERLAFLQPRLARLLAELNLLDATVDPSLEPNFTPRDTFGEDRHAG